ncbi:hypothetical protein LB566_23310 [Mesorhizobium sp. CA13]|uniref:hypothetical protein n=1 Tax=Mesorhizobium sp. CA13 TaxID=2876643 RepID=UPI001CC92674|nr:hypothetical protein [Mesorhizobium sp. CA13]MBZ9856724.1 hypothetical protein [Mesorhizobium sp. CA13]
MEKIVDWTARRAGGRITINGFDAETRVPVKIVGVDEIVAGRDGKPPIATDKDGDAFYLG